MSVSDFADFLTGSVTPEEIKVQVGVITHSLGMAFWSTYVGVLSGLVGVVLLVLQSRRKQAPAVPMQKEA
ncbi:hypothetical protein HQ590_02630 [bacterium]|nr:hypothetical protein [bacterium]